MTSGLVKKTTDSNNLTEIRINKDSRVSCDYVIIDDEGFAIDMQNEMLEMGESTETIKPIQASDYLWKSYSDSFSFFEYYEIIRDYEKRYNKSSEKLFEEWQSGELKDLSSEISDWIASYLKIKDFVK